MLVGTFPYWRPHLPQIAAIAALHNLRSALTGRLRPVAVWVTLCTVPSEDGVHKIFFEGIIQSEGIFFMFKCFILFFAIQFKPSAAFWSRQIVVSTSIRAPSYCVPGDNLNRKQMHLEKCTIYVSCYYVSFRWLRQTKYTFLSVSPQGNNQDDQFCVKLTHDLLNPALAASARFFSKPFSWIHHVGI